MLLRRERPEDVDQVRAVVGAAFTRPEDRAQVPVEVPLLDELRRDRGWLPALSVVATEVPGGAVLGHVVCTRGAVDDHPALGLGPLAVHPDHQGSGVGTALMHAVLGAAEGRDERIVALLGEPAFYARFGFRPAGAHGIGAPDPAWGDYFQVRRLGDDAAGIVGSFRYAAPFGRL